MISAPSKLQIKALAKDKKKFDLCEQADVFSSKQRGEESLRTADPGKYSTEKNSKSGFSLTA